MRLPVTGARRALAKVACATAILGAAGAVHAQTAPFDDAKILGAAPEVAPFRIDAVTTRISSFDQFGHGYQAQGGPTPTSPGSERAAIFEPQLAIDASQGPKIRHRIWIPVDVVTNASADAIDVVTSASRHVEGGSLTWAVTDKLSPVDELTVLSGLHLENPFRSWQAGLSGSRELADGDTVISAGVLEVYDWFDKFDIHGGRHGRTSRSSATANVGITQIVTATTILNVNYGLTVQRGTLGNTWNSVPLAAQDRGPELLPATRVRHALVGRAAQFLPWNGALHVAYRFYADDWGIVAHSLEGELLQRFAPWLYVGVTYRYHSQTSVDFFTTLAAPTLALRTADSDLASLRSETIGGKVALDVPVGRGGGGIRSVHFEAGYDRYVRTNDLSVNVVTCETGYRF